ncbi:MAG TPA: formyltransferase family protein [Gemmatimonadaceae bacterium]|nr:formyltransferase family protein [Gemmatimonadaceae bacterium]
MSPGAQPTPRTFLICHRGAVLHEEGLARWLAAETELTGVLVIDEDRATVARRARRQLRRDGLLRFLDVLAFRAYYLALLRGADRRWTEGVVARLSAAYPPVPASVPRLTVRSPNSREAEDFLRACAPDVTLALCKNLLKKSVFTIPRHGTFVLHPGICPEYRNAHGCFWALVQGDLENVGMTMLRIDEGVDTGPVYGYFRCAFDELRESHLRIQHRMTFDNLEGILALLREIVAGRARPIDTTGRRSAVWGQPWLSSYLRWRLAARRRASARLRAAVS